MAQEAPRLRWLQTDHPTYEESQRRMREFWFEHVPSMDLPPRLKAFASVEGPMPLLHDAWVTRLGLTDGLLRTIELFTVAQGSKCGRLQAAFESTTETLGLDERSARMFLDDPARQIVGYELDHAGDGGFELRLEAADGARCSVCFTDLAWSSIELSLEEYVGEGSRRQDARPFWRHVTDEVSWYANSLRWKLSKVVSVGRRLTGFTSAPPTQLMRWRYADSDAEATDARWAAYDVHLAQARDRFPSALRELTDGGPLDISELLHDAYAVGLERSSYDTWTFTAICPNSRGQHELELQLSFTGADLLGPGRDEIEPFFEQPGAGLDYCEVDFAADGERFELRLVSWADLPQFGFRFRDVSYVATPLLAGSSRAEVRRRLHRS